jgi:predicted kinase
LFELPKLQIYKMPSLSALPSLILIRALPKSGKTTLAEQLKHCCDLDHFEADQFFEGPDGYVYEPGKITDAHDACFAWTERSLSQGRGVVVANTFIKKWEMDPYMKLRQGYSPCSARKL